MPKWTIPLLIGLIGLLFSSLQGVLIFLFMEMRDEVKETTKNVYQLRQDIVVLKSENETFRKLQAAKRDQ